jgi:iron complex outermembrane receptor protein
MTKSTSRRMLLNTSALAGAIALAVLAVNPAAAQDNSYNIPSEPLSNALRDYGRVSGRQLIFTEDLVRGRTAPAVVGSYSADGALARLLEGTGLKSELSPSGAVMIEKVSGPQGDGAQTEPATNVAEVVVTGSHIRGVQPSSPVVIATQAQIQEAGHADLGEYARSLPENFNGGQNPGLAFMQLGSAANGNQTGGSGFDLRGLGPDATLTLLNGRRLSYDGSAQAVDVSQIPLAAIDQVQVLLDGASAVYGTDAVGGVVNVVLKRDFEGATASVRFGGATDGGDGQQQYSLVTGKTWDSGGFIATYSSAQNKYILASQRAYTKYMEGPTDLYPSLNESSGVFSAHQDIDSAIHLSIDAVYSHRYSGQFINELPFSTENSVTTDRSYTVSPTISFDLPNAWNLSLNGVVSEDDSYTTSAQYDDQHVFLYGGGSCACNGMKSIEVDGGGPLFSLPGGTAKVAFGAGYRINSYGALDENPANAQYNYQGSTRSTYGFGEFDAPLVSPAQEIPGINRLSLNAALRYEDYNQFGGAVAPKVGLIWAPTSDIDVKASWGRSFKTPTLDQQHQPGQVVIWPANEFDGGAGYPADAGLLEAAGGNTNLRPETATTVTAGLVYRPAWAAGLRLELNYFNIDYTNRIIQPIGILIDALSNPAYSHFVTYNPSAALQASYINSVAPSNYYDFLPGPYTPANVVAFIDNLYQNAARQSYDGVDVSVSYTRDFAGGVLTPSGTASWLEGTQQDSPTSPRLATIGTVFNPPHWRGRGGIGWRRSGLSLSLYANYIGGLIDTAVTPNRRIGSQTTADLVVGYKFQDTTGPLRDLDLLLVVNNLTDARPPYRYSSSNDLEDYDSTNYSPIGRLITVSVSKHFR